MEYRGPHLGVGGHSHARDPRQAPAVHRTERPGRPPASRARPFLRLRKGSSMPPVPPLVASAVLALGLAVPTAPVAASSRLFALKKAAGLDITAPASANLGGARMNGDQRRPRHGHGGRQQAAPRRLGGDRVGDGLHQGRLSRGGRRQGPGLLLAGPGHRLRGHRRTGAGAGHHGGHPESLLAARRVHQAAGSPRHLHQLEPHPRRVGPELRRRGHLPGYGAPLRGSVVRRTVPGAGRVSSWRGPAARRPPRAAGRRAAWR